MHHLSLAVPFDAAFHCRAREHLLNFDCTRNLRVLKESNLYETPTTLCFSPLNRLPSLAWGTGLVNK